MAPDFGTAQGPFPACALYFKAYEYTLSMSLNGLWPFRKSALKTALEKKRLKANI
jgi:hypothetical protein